MLRVSKYNTELLLATTAVLKSVFAALSISVVAKVSLKFSYHTSLGFVCTLH